MPVAVTESVALEPLVTASETGCAVMLAGALTVNVKVPLDTFPTLSVAVAVTVVVPMANVPPLTGE